MLFAIRVSTDKTTIGDHVAYTGKYNHKQSEKMNYNSFAHCHCLAFAHCLITKFAFNVYITF